MRSLKDLTNEEWFKIFHERFEFVNEELYWKKKPEITGHDKAWNTRYAGTKAGNKNLELGYINVVVNNYTWKLHRVVFLMANKYLPLHVDHIDGDARNNKVSNLRAATTSENNYNRSKKNSISSSQYKGVYYVSKRNCFRACVYANGGQMHLGYFDSPKRAALAYNEAVKAIGGEFVKLNVIEDEEVGAYAD